MSEFVTITESELPPAHTLIECRDGHILPLMFYFATELDDPKSIAKESGYDAMFITLADYVDRKNEALAAHYGRNMESDVISSWWPTVPDGWLFGGRWDGEDGPVACFLRRRQPRGSSND